MSSQQMDVDGMYKGAALLSRPAEEYVNDQTVEALWVRKCCQHAEIYYNLIRSVTPQLLKLTRHDDRIFDAYMKRFSSLNLYKLTSDDLKSDDNKILWMQFCEELKDIEDYNFGTLLRLDSRGDYSEENSILVTRIQFLGVEIARNRAGCNNYVWARAKMVRMSKSDGNEAGAGTSKDAVTEEKNLQTDPNVLEQVAALDPNKVEAIIKGISKSLKIEQKKAQKKK